VLTPRAVIHAALRHQGAPYLWGAKGFEVWTPQGLKRHDYAMPLFDCSGLVTAAIKDAGGPDLRATHNAKMLFDTLTEAPNSNERGVLRFYGASLMRPTHVSIALGDDLILEAGGGDSSTTTLEISRRQGARVRIVYEGRRDLLGARYLPSIPVVRS